MEELKKMEELRNQYTEGLITFTEFVFNMLLLNESGQGVWWEKMYNTAVEQMDMEAKGIEKEAF